MIETYRDMDLIYTSYQEVQKDVLSQGHFSVTLCLDRQSGKAVFADENGEKTVIQHTDFIEFLTLGNALQITIQETDGTVWVFAKRGSEG